MCEEKQFQGIIMLGANFHGEFFRGAILGRALPTSASRTKYWTFLQFVSV